MTWTPGQRLFTAAGVPSSEALSTTVTDGGRASDARRVSVERSESRRFRVAMTTAHAAGEDATVPDYRPGPRSSLLPRPPTVCHSPMPLAMIPSS